MLADRGAATPAAVSSFRSLHLSPGKFLLCYLGGGGNEGELSPLPPLSRQLKNNSGYCPCFICWNWDLRAPIRWRNEGWVAPEKLPALPKGQRRLFSFPFPTVTFWRLNLS